MSNSNITNFDNNNNKNSPDKAKGQYDICLFCDKCEMIYKSNLIKFKCHLTEEEFYSKIINNNNENKSFPFATWKEYHCNAVINDKMKCQICNDKLYFISSKKVLCRKCNKEFNPLDIKYKCLVCKNTFSSEAKVFNPLEYKALKICLKEAIISKIKAKPNNLGCGCKSDINKIKFIHRKVCRGELFLGLLNNKKVVVCNKCDSIGLYDNYIWTCPICFKKFRDNKEHDEEIHEEVKDIVVSPFKTKKHNKEKSLSKTDIKSIIYRNIDQKENFNALNNKEKINTDEIISIKEKNNKNLVLKKTSILKILEKKSTGLELQSRLFTEIDNNHIINIIEQNENNNSSNKKKRKLNSICSKLINYTPGAGNKCESKIINRIPKGNFNLLKINKIDSHNDMEVKNLDNLFQQSMDTSGQEIKSPRKKNKNISDLPITRNLSKMHKAISSKDIRNKKDDNFLYSDLIAERINKNVKKNSVLNINKPSKTPFSSRDIISNSKNDVSSIQKK